MGSLISRCASSILCRPCCGQRSLKRETSFSEIITANQPLGEEGALPIKQYSWYSYFSLAIWWHCLSYIKKALSFIQGYPSKAESIQLHRIWPKGWGSMCKTPRRSYWTAVYHSKLLKFKNLCFRSLQPSYNWWLLWLSHCSGTSSRKVVLKHRLHNEMQVKRLSFFSLFLRDTKNSTLVSASSQLRLRDCQNIHLFVGTESDPIIEASTEVIVAPYFLSYKGIKGNKWNITIYAGGLNKPWIL